jgi:uncharacterized membrane protein
MTWGYGEGWGMPMFGGPLALIVIAAVAFYAFRGNGGADASTPRATLDRSYADGEITKDRYDQMKRDLAT